MLKNIQKETKNNKPEEEKDNSFKFITTLAVLLILFILSYFLIGYFYTKEINFSKEKEKKEDINIDNDTIMLGQLFDQSDNEYYVLIYNPEDKVSSISSWLGSYQSGSDNTKLYKVDSTKGFNAKYIVKKDSNKQATNVNELKVIEPTLIKVSNKSIADYIEGEDGIVKILKGE